MTDLRVDWCSFDAATYAVMHWHYSRTMPVGKVVKIGAWEDETFIGAVLFARGSNNNLGSPYGLAMTECVELVRVALRAHRAPVSQIVARSIVLLRQNSPGLRLVVSFADPNAGHHGGIYQAGNWLYLGRTNPKKDYLYRGQVLNRRAYTGRQFGTGRRSILPQGAKKVEVPGKHRYVLPLDRAMRRKLLPLALPFPLPAVQGSTGAARHPDGKGEFDPHEPL